MYTAYCRTVQSSMRVGMKLMNWRKPELLQGENSLEKLPDLVKSLELNMLLVITDEGIHKLGLMDKLLEGLQEQNIAFVVYSKTVPNPTFTNIEEALELYNANNCDGIIAFGGGSPMDCAKAVAARIARPDKSLVDLKGLFKVRKEMPPFFAIPTTAGTGSEGTIAAVVSNSETHEKFAIMDPVLVPHYAVLDPVLTINLPPHITSTTGMDALTHAVEAYIGKSNTEETRKYAREAVILIFKYLERAYVEGTDMKARTEMQRASYLAGLAFTRAYVGYVHAIAHTLGGFYQVPHGFANAIILPHVLRFYGKSAAKPLAELATIVGIGKITDSDEKKAKLFIEAIEALNEKMNIPRKITGIINRDVPLMVERAIQEANPLYPVPRIVNKDEMFYLYQVIQE
ncbi:Alcohol dehydrogenase 2 [Solibacillus isronensis B3W22]|uniref:Alcohol dehydrogenase 2 n=1 Tax=Solibacillus isronensis B3W22 TaxID=1224748 RepID=K1LGF1_9BACL|nr:iron-containing alcohol dehydrogenase [Solibacillus isronensis]AMO86057.1 alcohol dehydrogenase [Solibacillus silvestris]EKB43589.1 Alcohol dehydrogenase 2 [Solibacillus isronensis B3W22]